MIPVDGGATGPARATFILLPRDCIPRAERENHSRGTCVCRPPSRRRCSSHVQRYTTGIFRLSEPAAAAYNLPPPSPPPPPAPMPIDRDAPFSFGISRESRPPRLYCSSDRVSPYPTRYPVPDTRHRDPRADRVSRSALCHTANHARIVASTITPRAAPYLPAYPGELHHVPPREFASEFRRSIRDFLRSIVR